MSCLVHVAHEGFVHCDLCCTVGVTADTVLKLSHEEESGSEQEDDRLGRAAVKRESKRASVSPAMGG